MSLSLKVGVIASSTINEALHDAQQLARKLDLWIEFDFNERFLFIGPDTDLQKEEQIYYASWAKKKEEQKQ